MLRERALNQGKGRTGAAEPLPEAARAAEARSPDPPRTQRLSNEGRRHRHCPSTTFSAHAIVRGTEPHGLLPVAGVRDDESRLKGRRRPPQLWRRYVTAHRRPSAHHQSQLSALRIPLRRPRLRPRSVPSSPGQRLHRLTG